VHDAALMRGFERLSHLLRERQCVGERERASGDALGQRLAVDPFEDERRCTVDRLQPVDGTDVWMIERGQDARQAIRVAREDTWQNFNRDLAAKLAVAGAIHLPHAAGTEPRLNRVRAERPADEQRGVTQNLARAGRRGRAQEGRRLGRLRQLRRDFASQRVVARASFPEKCGAGQRVARQRGVIDPLDVRPALRRHRPPVGEAHATATPSRAASRA
jgi:hypothetical protein